MRRLFWALVLAVACPPAAILQWSAWRRWHQAGAAWHHARRRARMLPPTPPPDPVGREPVAPAGMSRSTSPAPVPTPPPEPGIAVVSVVWARLEPLLPAPRRNGRQIVYDRRTILEAIVYVMQTDCGWKALPSSFPPWKTVQDQFVQWRDAGIWDQIWQGLAPPGPRTLE